MRRPTAYAILCASGVRHPTFEQRLGCAAMGIDLDGLPSGTPKTTTLPLDGVLERALPLPGKSLAEVATDCDRASERMRALSDRCPRVSP